MKYLINKGADINAKNNIGHTPLQCASIYRKLEVVKYLRNKGAILTDYINWFTIIIYYYYLLLLFTIIIYYYYLLLLFTIIIIIFTKMIKNYFLTKIEIIIIKNINRYNIWEIRLQVF